MIDRAASFEPEAPAHRQRLWAVAPGADRTGRLLALQRTAGNAAVGRVLEDKDLAASFAQAGMRRVAELFSMERSVRETEHLYQRLVEAGGCV